MIKTLWPVVTSRYWLALIEPAANAGLVISEGDAILGTALVRVLSATNLTAVGGIGIDPRGTLFAPVAGRWSLSPLSCYTLLGANDWTNSVADSGCRIIHHLAYDV